MEGKTVYLKKEQGADLKTYKCFNGTLEISFWNTGHLRIDSESYLDAEHFMQDGYQRIKRTEFMEAYLPIAEKMNNKIGEL